MRGLTTKTFRYVIQPVFNGIGYFFGFSLVVMLSVGLLLPGPFDELGADSFRQRRSVLYREHGKYFVKPECVVVAGWALLGGLAWIALMSSF